jgi:hypothetical protein
MDDHVEAALADELRGLGARDARLDEAGGGIQVLASPAGEVVDHGHGVAAVEEQVGDVGADETGATGDERVLGHRGSGTNESAADGFGRHRDRRRRRGVGRPGI